MKIEDDNITNRLHTIPARGSLCRLCLFGSPLEPSKQTYPILLCYLDLKQRLLMEIVKPAIDLYLPLPALFIN